MLTRRQALGQAGVWLLDLEVSGQRFRFASEPVTVADQDGLQLAYGEGLADLEAGLSSLGSVESSLELELDVPEQWAELVARFRTTARSPATLRRWFEGQTIEQARIVLDGEVASLAYGERLEAVTVTLARGVQAQARTLPSPGMVVDPTTWPVRGGWVLDEKVVGAAYPIVIGAPGLNPTGTNYPTVPGLLVETEGPDTTDRLLIAGHPTLAVGGTLRVWDYTDANLPLTGLRPVTATTDGQGRTVTVLTLNPPLGGIAAEPGRVYYVAYALVAGGLRSPHTDGLLRGAGDVITWLLSTWTDVPVDRPRLGALRERLNRYQIDTWLNAPVDPIAWLNDTLVPILPIEPRQGPDGLYFALFPTEVSAIDAVAHLDADTGELQRESAIEIDSGHIVNEVTVAYGPDRDTGRLRFRITLSGSADRRLDEFEGVVNDSRVEGNYLAALSQRQFGRRPQTIEAHAIWDPATAARIAQDVITRQALPQRFVDYAGGPELEAFEPGQIVTITDTAVQLDEHLAVILDVEVGGPDVLLSLQLLDDPVVARRATEAEVAPAPVAPVIATVAGGATAATDTWAMTNPAGVEVGDLLLLLLEADGVDNPDALVGWNELVRDNGSGKAHLSAWRIADGTEGATTTVTMPTPNELCGWVLRITGHDPVAPINAVMDQHRAAATSQDVNPATATVAPCLGITVFGYDGGDGGVFAISTGAGTYTIQDQQSSGPSSNDVAACYATHVQATAGPCPDCTFEAAVADGATLTQILIAPETP